ncbi:hypothetical protein Tco_0103892 [Tanacetum coccineum]
MDRVGDAYACEPFSNALPIDKLLLVQVMDVPAVSVFVDSSEESFRDTIEIGVDVTHPVPITSAVFPAATMVIRLAQHGRRNRDERQTRIEIEHQLALVQKELTQSRISHAQERENFKKLRMFHATESQL